MRKRILLGLLGSTALIGSAVAGRVAGRFLSLEFCGALVQLSSLSALILAVIDSCPFEFLAKKRSQAEQLSAFGLLIYIVTYAVFVHYNYSPLCIWDDQSVHRALAWLSPLFLGAILPPWQNGGRARWIWWAMIFNGVAIVTYNSLHYYSHLGFWYTAQY